MSIRDTLTRILAEYETASKAPFSAHPLAAFIRHEAADEVSASLGAARKGLVCQGSAGAGNWAEVPWIAVFDPLVTDSATRGYYVVYLFSAQGTSVHLSLNQGTTATREEFGSEARRVLTERATFMRSRLGDFAPSLSVTAIELGSERRLPGDYAAGHALGLTYHRDQLPDEPTLQSDLQAIVRAYRALTFRGGFDEVPELGGAPDDEGIGAGSLFERRQYGFHRRIERNRKAAALAKTFHGTRCQACSMDFGEKYGALGQGFIEAHHLKPIASLQEGLAVEYDVAADLAVLCSNCHRMIHRTKDPSNLAAFKEIIGQSNGGNKDEVSSRVRR
jgi:5-methylcytosine-specific restriction protein A